MTDDKPDQTAWCHGCHTRQPKGGWVKGKCPKCATRMRKPDKFDAAGNLIKRKKAVVAATASDTTNGRK